MENIEMKDLKFKKLRVGDIIVGEAISVKETVVMLDINYVTEGTIYLNEFTKDSVSSLKEIVNIGDKIEAVVKKITEEDGSVNVYLSRIPLIKKDHINKIKQAFQNKETLELPITRSVNKGLIANYLGIDIFIPESQVSLESKFDLNNYVNKTLKLRLIDIDEKKQRYIASHKVILFEEYIKNKNEELESIKTNSILEGVVVRVESYGALVKFNYNQGLLRISQLAHTKVDKVTDVVNVGDKVTVKVIKKEENQLDLSLKALTKTPFDMFMDNHKVGETVKGIVVQKLPIGLIVEVAPHVTGLLHINEYTWNPNENFMAYIKLQDEITASILSIDGKKKRISLSKKALEDNPWQRVTAKVDDIVEVEVSGILPGKGVNVTIQGVDAFIPLSELSNSEKISKIEDYFAVGDKVKAKVTELKINEWIFTLSIRRLEAANERAQFEKYMEKSQDDSKVTLGDLFKDLLKK